jgi:hypothetical protein
MILPQSQTIFRRSGRLPGDSVDAAEHLRYLETFLALRPNLECHHSSLDTELPGYKSEWRGAAPVVEVVSFDDPAAKETCKARYENAWTLAKALQTAGCDYLRRHA